MAIRYTDWQISKKHAEAINALALPGMQRVKVQKRIPGVGASIIDGRLSAGVWLQPLGFQLGRAFSSVHDKGRTSLLILAAGSSTNQADDDPTIVQWREAIGDLFDWKRVTGLDGENYTQVILTHYEMDKDLARRMDVISLKIVSWFREDRR